MAYSRVNLYSSGPDRENDLPRGRAGLAPGAAPAGRPSSDGQFDRALNDLAALSYALLDTLDEAEILGLAMDHVEAVGAYRAEAGFVERGGGLIPAPANGRNHPSAVDRRVRELAGQDGPVTVPDRPWGRALGLRGLQRLHGYLVVTSDSEPTETERFLLSTLVRYTAAAMSLAFAHRRLSDQAVELHRVREERLALQRQLISVVAEQRYQRAVHTLITDVAATGGGEEAVTRALHGLTGLPALVEDRFGRLRSWCGPSRPDPYPEPDPVRQDEMLHAVAREAGPVRMGDRLLTLVRPHGEILGVLALIDAEGEADEHTVLALENAATSLALELGHMRDLAEVELGLRRELADDLLAGTDTASAYARSEAIGHDLHRSHYIVVVQWSKRTVDDSFAETVGRAAAAQGMRSLLTRRSDHVVLVADARPRVRALYEALTVETGTHSGAIGVSAPCDSPNGIPRGYQEAQRALEVRRQSREGYGTTFFDELGLYRILGPGNNYQQLEAFVHEWIGQLIEYDSRHHATMVDTLTRYFDCGGNYEETAASLAIHRSTLRYRLQRIRDISGNDLANVEDRLNLQVATRVWKIVLGGSG
ncbi:helix-turn-helix domain-containing protein [Streptomyces coelicoflavus]|uniref:PucR family transcriptional regulator n=1 Tax=Streptomyces coelicoflavus TaxID=285562 RepID=UPI00210A860F|nr:helix-turn-helix domain-containing protein [Streptomyces coelicoflavus]MCQ4198795.1 helix-turn-helix domain-containing protein [Streptomyces coelicoflavus]